MSKRYLKFRRQMAHIERTDMGTYVVVLDRGSNPEFTGFDEKSDHCEVIYYKNRSDAVRRARKELKKDHGETPWVSVFGPLVDFEV